MTLLMLAAGCTPGNLISWGSGWTATAAGKTPAGKDVVYVASKSGEVVALDPANGRVLELDGVVDGRQEWRVPLDGGHGVFGEPAIGDKYIYVGDKGNRSGEETTLYAINSGDSARRWARSVGQPIIGGPALGDGLVIVGSNDGNLYAFGEETGDRAWFFKTGGPVWSAPVIADGLVYFGSMDKHIYAVHSTGDDAGDEKWSYKTGGAVISKPLLLDGMVIVGSFDKKLYALDSEDGTFLWSFGGDDWFWAGAASDGERIFATTMGGKVYALDKGGGEAWAEPFEAESPIVSVPVIIDNKLVVGTDGGKLFLLNARDGGVLHSRVMDNAVKAQITVKSRGQDEDFIILFVGLQDGTVRGVKLDLQVDQLGETWRYPPEK